MVNQKVTLSIDKEIYKKFQEFCKKNDIMVSKRIERLIDEHVGQGGKKES